ncbi:MAG: hypothetical protein E6H04_15045 [Bacillati bacterium ANGP1]|uniref:Uncharacterized protein n=1 Tax=Candidatus Segetimicrobium genomatis TaxID=2569760 RepID=A0A537IYF4_9BACT|nr:MAG: hypothetical protein E6H04_15045 [Terrabacteria group bacterium ANGP1]
MAWSTPRATKHTPSWRRSYNVGSWRRRLGLVERAILAEESSAEAWPPGREVLYVIDAGSMPEDGALALEVASRRRKANGEWQTLMSCPMPGGRTENLPDASDRRILSILTGATNGYGYGPYASWVPRGGVPLSYAVSPSMQETLIPLMCRTDRLQLRVAGPGAEGRQVGEARPASGRSWRPSRRGLPAEDIEVQWDDGPPWEFHLEVERTQDGASYVIAGVLRRGEERLPLADPVLLLPSGFVLSRSRCGPARRTRCWRRCCGCRGSRGSRCRKSFGSRKLQARRRRV